MHVNFNKDTTLYDFLVKLPTRATPRVEQPSSQKMHLLSGALVAQPRYPLLVLNNYSADSNKLTGHRKHA